MVQVFENLLANPVIDEFVIFLDNVLKEYFGYTLLDEYLGFLFPFLFSIDSPC